MQFFCTPTSAPHYGGELQHDSDDRGGGNSEEDDEDEMRMTMMMFSGALRRKTTTVIVQFKYLNIWKSHLFLESGTLDSLHVSS
jgi:hypothetical protein